MNEKEKLDWILKFIKAAMELKAVFLLYPDSLALNVNGIYFTAEFEDYKIGGRFDPINVYERVNELIKNKKEAEPCLN